MKWRVICQSKQRQQCASAALVNVDAHHRVL
jgi:hypothetical protein